MPIKLFETQGFILFLSFPGLVVCTGCFKIGLRGSIVLYSKYFESLQHLPSSVDLIYFVPGRPSDAR